MNLTARPYYALAHNTGALLGLLRADDCQSPEFQAHPRRLLVCIAMARNELVDALAKRTVGNPKAMSRVRARLAITTARALCVDAEGALS